MEFIEAVYDRYGNPDYMNLIWINPKYIISIEYYGARTDSNNIEIDEHYTAVIDFGNKTETVHISLEDGNKILGRAMRL